MSVITDIRRDLEGEAFRLFREYHGRLMAEGMSLCANPSIAEDLVMRTFEVYFSGKCDCDPAKGDLLPWLKGVLRGIHRDSTRGKARAAVVYLSPEDLQIVADTQAECGDASPFSAEDQKMVADAIQSLSPKLREAVLLHYYESKSVLEIARMLRVSEGGVKNRLFCARKVLAKRLGRKLGKVGAVLAALAIFATAATAAVAWVPALKPIRVAVARAFDGTEDEGRGTEVKGQRLEVRQLNLASDAPAAFSEVTTSQPSQPSQLSQTFSKETQQMKLTQSLAAAALAVTAAVVTVETEGVTLKVDQVRQRYPWNGLVDIDYTITTNGVETLGVDDNLEVLFIDRGGDAVVTNRALTFLQAPLPLANGQHRITWNANADGVTNRTDDAVFQVKIAHYSAQYMVIDVSGGSAANVYPVEYLNGEPAGGFNVPEYKGNKIVLRRIHPGSYMAGSPTDEANRTTAREVQHRVALSKPFYIGIFEITQQQCQNVMGSSSSTFAGEYRPVDSANWSGVRGGTWPDGLPAANSFMGKLVQKCKSLNAETGEYDVEVPGFDLPTEFQWEYACRAGTTKAFNLNDDFDNTSNVAQTNQLWKAGRYVDNQTDGAGGIMANHTIVGSYQPNQWGLYDMHGNVWEHCLDLYAESPASLNQYVDPKGGSTGGSHVQRGGSWKFGASYCRSAYHGYASGPAYTTGNLGFRLCRTVP